MYKIYRLLNGDEIIGSVVHENNQVSTLEDPFTIDYFFNEETGKTHITMSKYMSFAANNATQINRDHITSEHEASENAVDYYLECLVKWAEDDEEELPTKSSEANEYNEKMKEILEVIQPNANTSLH